MASPLDPSDSCRDQVAEALSLSSNPSLIEKPTVEQGSLYVENANSSANKALNLKSVQEETQNLQKQEETQNLEKQEESDARYQQAEASIEECRDEEYDMVTTQLVNSSVYRRRGGARRKKGSQKKRKPEAKSKEKLELLLKTLKPVAFVPGKTLDFSRHEKLLKTLGLWEFLHLEFDQNIRQDLVANLVAYYNPDGRCSYVNGARINVSRPDLARALKLPYNKAIVVTEEERKILESDESIRFVEEILSTWVLLLRDDIWIMPVEVFEWERKIKQKQLEKLDWATFLWFMVEKELKAEPLLGDCFFASHLQLLIKSQKEDLLRERSIVNTDVKEVDCLVESPREDCLEVKEQDVTAADSGRNDDAIDSKEEKYVEEDQIELNLGREETVTEMVFEEERGPVDGHPMDFQENKKEEDEKLSWNEDTNAGFHFFRRCNLSSVTEGDKGYRIERPMEMIEDEPVEDVGEEEEETEEDKEKDEEEFPFFPNGDSLHGIGQENLILGDASPLDYNSGLQIHGNLTGGDFLASRVAMISGSFGNGNNKKEIDHENDISYHSHNPKRLRTEEPSWNEKPPPMEMSLDQITYWVEKARMSCAEKDQERGQSVMNQQYLMQELQNKEEMIQNLERTKFEEQQRQNFVIYKLESELRMLTSVIQGYRKVLKETKKATRQHMKHCPLRNDDKPVYKDVKDSGGLVLSSTEIEKLRFRQEVEDRIEEFGSYWLKVFQDHMETVELLNKNLIEVENEVKIKKETLLKSKNHKNSEVSVTTTEDT